MTLCSQQIWPDGCEEKEELYDQILRQSKIYSPRGWQQPLGVVARFGDSVSGEVNVGSGGDSERKHASDLLDVILQVGAGTRAG